MNKEEIFALQRSKIGTIISLIENLDKEEIKTSNLPYICSNLLSIIFHIENIFCVEEFIDSYPEEARRWLYTAFSNITNVLNQVNEFIVDGKTSYVNEEGNFYSYQRKERYEKNEKIVRDNVIYYLNLSVCQFKLANEVSERYL